MKRKKERPEAIEKKMKKLCGRMIDNNSIYRRKKKVDLEKVRRILRTPRQEEQKED